MMGRQPEPDDLILPLPPDDAAARRSRSGEPIRTGDYAGKKWREHDLVMLGWRSRELYATKSTFITLAIEDGADEDVIRERVTHARARRNAFDGYDRADHWLRTCAEMAKLRIRRCSPGEVIPRTYELKTETRVTDRVTVDQIPKDVAKIAVEAAGVERGRAVTP